MMPKFIQLTRPLMGQNKEEHLFVNPAKITYMKACREGTQFWVEVGESSITVKESIQRILQLCNPEAPEETKGRFD